MLENLSKMENFRGKLILYSWPVIELSIVNLYNINPTVVNFSLTQKRKVQIYISKWQKDPKSSVWDHFNK